MEHSVKHDESLKIARQSTGFYAFARVVCTPLLSLLYRVSFTNRFNIPKEGKYIICSNHLSYLDPLLLGMGQKRRIRYMAKSELFKNKLFSKVITSLGAFPVYRGQGDNTAINVGEKILDDGGVMGIFFEGKRSKTGELLRPKSGAMLIAYESKAPIIPACITPEKGLIKIFRKTRVSFGEPVTIEELGVKGNDLREFRNASKEVMKRVEKLREETLLEWEKKQ